MLSQGTAIQRQILFHIKAVVQQRCFRFAHPRLFHGMEARHLLRGKRTVIHADLVDHAGKRMLRKSMRPDAQQTRQHGVETAALGKP